MTSRYFEEKLVAQNYAKHRPSYPDSVFTTCIDFLKAGEKTEAGKFALAVDVGCGTGHHSTVPLAKHFKTVVGIDISEEQIAEAKRCQHPENVTFSVSAAEALPFKDGTVSFLQVATAAHWIDMGKFYKEADRVLSPGGVVALVCYVNTSEASDHPNSAEVNPILLEMMDRPEKRGFYVIGNYLANRRYNDDCFKIPYDDCMRKSNIPLPMPLTVETYLDFYKNLSLFRRMEKAEPELTAQWMEDVTQRLLKALGTTDLSSPFTFFLETFILLGRKPYSVHC